MDKILEYLHNNTEFIVHCDTREEAIEFLLFAKSNAVRWCSGRQINESDFDGKYFSFRIDDERELRRADRGYYSQDEFCYCVHLEWADCIKSEFDEQSFTELLLGE